MNPQTMEYQPTKTPSYPPQPSRPGPTPLTNAAATAPALYGPASGATGAAGPSGYPSGGAGGGGYYPDHHNHVQQPQLPPRLDGKADRTIKSARSTCEFAAREYLTQLRKIGPGNGGSSYSVSNQMTAEAFARARSQQVLVLDELAALRRSVAVVIKEAEAHRWRRWVLGGVLASIIPLVRRVFRRPSPSKDGKKKGEDHVTTTTTTISTSKTSESNSHSSSNAIMNATEYAFAKSRSLIRRIRASVRGSGWFLGGFAAVAFFVLSVLYVFENEVSLRVAKTVDKRLKRLAAKVERGGARTGSGSVEALDEKDLLVLQQGWRWRVLTWSG